MGEKTSFSVKGYGGRVSSIKVEIIGTTLEEVEDAVKRLGKVPKSVAYTPAKYAARRVLALTKKVAPRRKGALRDGLMMGEEKFVRRGKNMFDIRMMSEKEWNAAEDARKGNGKQRRSYLTKDGQRGFADKAHTYFYPSSVEYGFRQRDGRHHPGQYYMKQTAEALDGPVQQIILDRAGKALDRIWERQQAGD